MCCHKHSLWRGGVYAIEKSLGRVEIIQIIIIVEIFENVEIAEIVEIQTLLHTDIQTPFDHHPPYPESLPVDHSTGVAMVKK